MKTKITTNASEKLPVICLPVPHDVYRRLKLQTVVEDSSIRREVVLALKAYLPARTVVEG